MDDKFLEYLFVTGQLDDDSDELEETEEDLDDDSDELEETEEDLDDE